MRTASLYCLYLAWLPAVVVTASITACSGDSVDQSNTCTGAVYDPCLTEHDCMSVDCRVINSELTCTQACSAATPCPDLDGQAVTCGVGGICEPPHPRDCEPK
ncbi:MAG TPA: hypothetical protein VGM39_20750 [Kofleriaceae bacterium]|jgi:hypothetical protein